jgi:hypothetical protein
MKTHAQNYNGGYYITDKKWLRIRQIALDYFGKTCLSCGYTGEKGIHVDHVLPKRDYPELTYDLMNLQVLCAACNMQKMVDEDDFRSPEVMDGYKAYLEEYKNKIIQEKGLVHFMHNHEHYGFAEVPPLKNHVEFMGELIEYETRELEIDWNAVFDPKFTLEGLEKEDKSTLLYLLNRREWDNVCRHKLIMSVDIDPKLTYIKTDTLRNLGYINHYQEEFYILNPEYFPPKEKDHDKVVVKWESSHAAGERKIASAISTLESSIKAAIKLHKERGFIEDVNKYDWLLSEVEALVKKYNDFNSENKSGRI